MKNNGSPFNGGRDSISNDRDVTPRLSDAIQKLDDLLPESAPACTCFAISFKRPNYARSAGPFAISFCFS